MKEYMYGISVCVVLALSTTFCASGEDARPDSVTTSDDIDIEDDGDSQDRTDADDTDTSIDDGDNHDTNNNQTGSDTDKTDDVEDMDTGKDADTGEDADTAIDANAPPCANYDYDKKTYDYGSDYAKGPYGFKGSMCWDMSAGEGRWTNHGDVIHDICLPNQDGEEVCLGEFYDAGYNLLIIEVSAIDCPACAAEARDEAKILDKFKDNYWNPVWVTIMGRSLSGSLPTVKTATNWKNQYGLGGEVLADTQGTWEQRMFLDKWPEDERGGVPLTFFVNPLNMVIWDAFAGWTDPAGFQEFADYTLDLAVYCSSNDVR